ncbi:MAG: 50S ribosomal protein L28 [Candidatus Magasanikbacteria bacterium]|jgi:ribosomal protein L28|nr:50S ribosomal protein L28 [Candidatus Magasanikbacteria bacterium]MBT4220755.1 50S ribosomal protein L28 [Candidatus Magasanikbacteria bacterium]MBT4350100.1 50S ribosomal protein L28 [Candidatus Magasanikbacteria bacterium]MBT4541457.1 50S ribosomal protein L28 [Candidatus Magasanikbacteria bacterium]MBT6252985.1 50S ribosomal protein L28 [Candidatus Magasanikbacteria bacterium]
MSRQCVTCGKVPIRAAHRSKAMNKTLRRQKPNLQKMMIDGKKEKVCTRCMRTMAKQTA